MLHSRNLATFIINALLLRALFSLSDHFNANQQNNNLTISKLPRRLSKSGLYNSSCAGTPATSRNSSEEKQVLFWLITYKAKLLKLFSSSLARNALSYNDFLGKEVMVGKKVNAQIENELQKCTTTEVTATCKTVAFTA